MCYKACALIQQELSSVNDVTCFHPPYFLLQMSETISMIIFLALIALEMKIVEFVNSIDPGEAVQSGSTLFARWFLNFDA